MKWLARLFALPIGLLVGAILWALLYLSVYDSISLFPLSTLLLTLSPGMIIGATLSFYAPGLFLWFLTWELDGDVSAELVDVDTHTDSDMSDAQGRNEKNNI